MEKRTGVLIAAAARARLSQRMPASRERAPVRSIDLCADESVFSSRRYTLDWPPESRAIEPNQRLLKHRLRCCSVHSSRSLAAHSFLARASSATIHCAHGYRLLNKAGASVYFHSTAVTAVRTNSAPRPNKARIGGIQPRDGLLFSRLNVGTAIFSPDA